MQISVLLNAIKPTCPKYVNADDSSYPVVILYHSLIVASLAKIDSNILILQV